MHASHATIGVWVPIDRDRPLPPPHCRPMGRAALRAQQLGLTVVFGDRWAADGLVGMVATSQGWQPTTQPVRAIQDRFPSQSRASAWEALHAGARRRHIPVGNGQRLTRLCRDKLRCQHALATQSTLRLPPVSGDSSTFRDLLHRWGSAYIKPRYGALGIGVRWVTPYDSIPEALPGVVGGGVDPTLLQWPVPPPNGLSGCVLRVLAQRIAGRSGPAGWLLLPPVMRASRKDRVVNAARGAWVGPAEDRLSAVVLDEVRQQVREACAVLARDDCSAGMALELGVDVAIDTDHKPWILEVNSRPRGRLHVLARSHPDRFADAQLQAMIRPWQTLAQWPEAQSDRTRSAGEPDRTQGGRIRCPRSQ